jgi:hypothetical protein
MNVQAASQSITWEVAMGLSKRGSSDKIKQNETG